METPKGWNVDFSDVRIYPFCCGNIRHIPLESMNDHANRKLGCLKKATGNPLCIAIQTCGPFTTNSKPWSFKPNQIPYACVAMVRRAEITG